MVQVRSLRNELFYGDSSGVGGAVTTLKRKRLGDKPTPGHLTFPPMSFISMKRDERTAFLAKLDRWLEELTLIADQLSLQHSDFCEYVFLMQGEIQIIIDKAADEA